MKYLFLNESSVKKIYDMLVTLGDKLPSYSTVKNWVHRFRTGCLSTEDRTFWETNSSDSSRKRACHSFHDPGRSKHNVKKIAETLAISQEGVGCIIHEILK
jgi:hypothetical protein